jgi:hypothetical protein
MTRPEFVELYNTLYHEVSIDNLEKEKSRFEDFNMMEMMNLNFEVPLRFRRYHNGCKLSRQVYETLSDYYDSAFIDELNSHNYNAPVVYVDPDLLPFVRYNNLTSDDKDSYVTFDEKPTELSKEAAHFVMLRRYLKYGNMRDNDYYWKMIQSDKEELGAADWIKEKSG